MTTTIPPTANKAWGFFGTIGHNADPGEAWVLAFTRVLEATASTDKAVRAFLDSRYGRLFADEVASNLSVTPELEPAIDGAIERWMEWRIDRGVESETGIPRGLPFLTGFVCMHEALLDAAD